MNPVGSVRYEGATGAYYGSYMVNWITGHTDRFAYLVSMTGAFNMICPALLFRVRAFTGETAFI